MASQARRVTRPAVSGTAAVVSPIVVGVFRQEGEYWTIEYGGTLFRLRDGKGLRYLAQLLRHPGRSFPATDLVEPSGATEDHSSQQSDSERARLAVTKRVKAAIGNITEYHPILGYHLGVTIRTGARCAYHPDPERQVSWATSATTSTRNEGG